jgi:hypothetical protein
VGVTETVAATDELQHRHGRSENRRRRPSSRARARVWASSAILSQRDAGDLPGTAESSQIYRSTTLIISRR